MTATIPRHEAESATSTAINAGAGLLRVPIYLRRAVGICSVARTPLRCRAPLGSAKLWYPKAAYVPSTRPAALAVARPPAASELPERTRMCVTATENGSNTRRRAVRRQRTVPPIVVWPIEGIAWLTLVPNPPHPHRTFVQPIKSCRQHPSRSSARWTAAQNLPPGAVMYASSVWLTDDAASRQAAAR